MQKKKTIVLDVDGVLLDFTKAADEYIKKHLNIEPITMRDDFNLTVTNMKLRYGLKNDNAVLKLLDEMVENGFYKTIPAFEGVLESVQKIKDENFKIIIVTAIHDGAKEDRLFNLENTLNLVPDEIYCVGMGKSKAQIIDQLKPDIFIDDRMKYLKGGNSVYHSVWVDQEESQEGDESLVNVHVKSLKEWVDRFMLEVSAILDDHYQDEAHLQIPLKLESVGRKYLGPETTRFTKEEYLDMLRSSRPRVR